MLIRKLTTSLFILTTAPLTVIAQGDNVPWHGSYAANGQCFCSGPIPQSISSKIVPTPIGGQTLTQVCAKIGDGPEVVKQNGLFNYTVYKDMQCGHGPSTKEVAVLDASCLGSKEETFESCLPAGPKWALDAVYASPAVLAVAKPDESQADATGSNVQTANASVGSANGQKQLLESEAQNAQTEIADITAAEEAITVDPLASFTGKIVNLGGDRFLQARENLSPNGGLPGSRIILDGKVFLKDDKQLVLADLYGFESPDSAPAPKVAAARPVEAAPAIPSKTRDKSEEQKFIDAMRAERQSALAKENAEKAKLASLRQLEKKNVEKIRAEQKRIAKITADQKKLAQKKAADDALVAKQNSALSDNELLVDENTDKSKAAFEASQQTTNLESGAATSGLSSVSNALRLPANTRASSRNFNYFEAMPTNYEFGGGGVVLEASLQRKSRFQFLGNVGTSDTYDEVMLGAGYYLTPESASRLTVVLLAGVEHGSFELTDPNAAPGLTVTTSDTGLFLGALSRVVINNKFELKGGLGYSSFFEGDATFFGGGYYHVTPRLDVVSRFELGDNDQLGLGIRYYY